MSRKGYNASSRLKARRQSALQRREKDVAHWTAEDVAGREVGHKLDRATQDVANLYVKLGLQGAKRA